MSAFFMLRAEQILVAAALLELSGVVRAARRATRRSAGIGEEVAEGALCAEAVLGRIHKEHGVVEQPRPPVETVPRPPARRHASTRTPSCSTPRAHSAAPSAPRSRPPGSRCHWPSARRRRRRPTAEPSTPPMCVRWRPAHVLRARGAVSARTTTKVRKRSRQTNVFPVSVSGWFLLVLA